MNTLNGALTINYVKGLLKTNRH